MAYNKYGAKPTFSDGIRFASKGEARRYEELKLLVRAGEIKDLKLQPKFELIPAYVNGAGEKIRKLEYVADFEYFEIEHQQWVIEDVKSEGTKTAIYLLKRKLFEKIYYPKTIKEVES